MSLTEQLQSAVRALDRAQKEVERLADAISAPLSRQAGPVVSYKDARKARILLSNIRHRARGIDEAVAELSRQP